LPRCSRIWTRRRFERWRAPLTALTIAEYFRDERRQNVLLLMDNVFRFVQAGSEVSGLLGRLPSRVGHQPALASEVAALQERIVSLGGVSVTAIEAVYVPADDFTDRVGTMPERGQIPGFYTGGP